MILQQRGANPVNQNIIDLGEYRRKRMLQKRMTRHALLHKLIIAHGLLTEYIAWTRMQVTRGPIGLESRIKTCETFLSHKGVHVPSEDGKNPRGNNTEGNPPHAKG